jgi:TRC40/GET3/ArsA family transport-energizing ATPase
MDSSRFLFFSGKGGVGKTSMAASTAVQEAEQGRKTLIVTTDPASSLADVFETEIGHRIAPIPGAPNLSAMEIDPDQATIEYKEKILGPMRGIFPADVIAVVEEQFNSPCTTEIAAFDRFVKFMDDPEFDLVIFDTAPTGHTIRTTRNGNRCSRIVRPLQRKDDMGNCCQLVAGTSRQAFRLASQAPIRRAVQSREFCLSGCDGGDSAGKTSASYRSCGWRNRLKRRQAQ